MYINNEAYKRNGNKNVNEMLIKERMLMLVNLLNTIIRYNVQRAAGEKKRKKNLEIYN